MKNVRYNYFRFSGRRLAFPVSADIGEYWPTSMGVDNESIESGDPANLRIAVLTACLSVVKREL